MIIVNSWMPLNIITNSSCNQDTFHNITITMTTASLTKPIAEVDLGDLVQHSRWNVF